MILMLSKEHIMLRPTAVDPFFQAFMIIISDLAGNSIRKVYKHNKIFEQ